MHIARPLILFFLLLSLPLNAQEIGAWDIYTSTRTISGLDFGNDGELWLSTTGGVEIRTSGELSRKFTTLDGLSRLDGQAAIFDSGSGKFFVGYIDGSVDIINSETGDINQIGDIARFPSYTEKGINDFEEYNGMLYIATDFGIVVFDPSGEYIIGSFTGLGEFTRGISVSDITINADTLYAATAEGLAAGALSDELSVNTNWVSHNATDGFVSEQVVAIGVTENAIYASTASQNYVYESGLWSTATSFGSNVIAEYLFNDDLLIAASRRRIFFGDNISSLQNAAIETDLTTILHEQGSPDIYFGTFNQGTGILTTSNLEQSYITPVGPYQNFFKGLTFEGETLISSSTNETARNSTIDLGKGYYIFSDGEWKSFNAQNNDVLNAFRFRQTFTSTTTQDYYYFGSWGEGIARHDKETDEVVVFNETNSTLRGWAADNPLYPVISGLGTDNNDDVWVTSRYATNPLYYQSPGDDDFLELPKYSGISSQDEYVGLFIDSYNQKWITLENSSSSAGTGLLVLDTGSPVDISDDDGVKLTTDENQGLLPDNSINAIIEDQNNEVWIGTGRGIARFIFPEFIITSSNPSERRSQWLINEDTSAISRFLLRDVNVSAMAVNGANQKWIGSVNQGVWLLNEEGSRIEKRFTRENSPLISNNIVSIAVNDITGEVFIATDLGLVSYQDVAMKAQSKMEELKVFPNPFAYDKHQLIYIEGLSEQTIIRVLGVDGTVVQEFESTGGRSSWDGLDYNGRKLGSGVYFVVAYESDGREKGIGKVVIIR